MNKNNNNEGINNDLFTSLVERAKIRQDIKNLLVVLKNEHADMCEHFENKNQRFFEKFKKHKTAEKVIITHLLLI